MIRFTQVSKRYGNHAALEDVDWEVEAGERALVLGHSGAGKTTLLRLITMELRPTRGTVEVGSFDSTRVGADRVALLRRSLGVVFEDLRLLPDRTAAENVEISLQLAGVWDPGQVRERVHEALERVGAADLDGARPHELSAGQRQRIAVARALVRQPALLVADEPTGKLEEEAARQVLSALHEANERGATLVISTNDEALASGFGGRVTRLVDGRIPVA